MRWGLLTVLGLQLSLALCAQQGVQADDATAAFTAVAAVVDSVCRLPKTTCQSVLVNRSVRRIRDILPQRADSMSGSFELPAIVPRQLGGQRPIKIADLGTNYSAGESEVRLWLFLVSKDRDRAHAAKVFTVAGFVPGLESVAGIVTLELVDRAWKVRTVRWITT